MSLWKFLTFLLSFKGTNNLEYCLVIDKFLFFFVCHFLCVFKSLSYFAAVYLCGRALLPHFWWKFFLEDSKGLGLQPPSSFIYFAGGGERDCSYSDSRWSRIPFSRWWEFIRVLERSRDTGWRRYRCCDGVALLPPLFWLLGFGWADGACWWDATVSGAGCVILELT